MKLPILIIVIGLVAAVVSCLLTGILNTPTVTEGEFHYSVTYKLNGEIKTLEGVYQCRFDGFWSGENPLERYYVGEYVVDGHTTDSNTFIIDQKDGSQIYIAILFNANYFMGDMESDYYEPFPEDPFLEALDEEGIPYDQEEMLRLFDAEIISWDYPEPVENTFVFSGFSRLHVGSMMAMLLVGLLVIIACSIFVKKEPTVTYKLLDKLSVVFNYIIGFGAISFIALIVWLLLITMSGDEATYQIFLCIPAFTAFTIAASVSLRRKGFTKAGFLVQFIGPVFFAVFIILESVIYNLFL